MAMVVGFLSSTYKRPTPLKLVSTGENPPLNLLWPHFS
jgi:hypothetical protein